MDRSLSLALMTVLEPFLLDPLVVGAIVPDPPVDVGRSLSLATPLAERNALGLRGPAPLSRVRFVKPLTRKLLTRL